MLLEPMEISILLSMLELLLSILPMDNSTMTLLMKSKVEMELEMEPVMEPEMKLEVKMEQTMVLLFLPHPLDHSQQVLTGQPQPTIWIFM